MLASAAATPWGLGPARPELRRRRTPQAPAIPINENLVKQTARAVVPGDRRSQPIATRTPAWRYCRPSPRGRHRRWQWSGIQGWKNRPLHRADRCAAAVIVAAQRLGRVRPRRIPHPRQLPDPPIMHRFRKTTLVQAAGTGYSTSAGRGEAAAEACSSADRSEPCATDRGAPSSLISTALTGARRAAARPDEARATSPTARRCATRLRAAPRSRAARRSRSRTRAGR